MNSFSFFTRGAGDAATTTNDNNNDPYSDSAPLSPGPNPNTTTDTDNPATTDLEAAREMTERPTPAPRFLHRFRPTIPSFFSTASSNTRGGNGGGAAGGTTHPNETGTGNGYGALPFSLPGFPFRPASSHYSGDGLRGAPDTVIDGGYGGGGGGGGGRGGYGGLPRSPGLKSMFGYGGWYGRDSGGDDDRYRIGEGDLDLPGARLDVPGLEADAERPWTRGSSSSSSSSGEESGAGTGTLVEEDDAIVEPAPAVVRAGRHDADGRRRTRRRGERDGAHRERRKRRRGERSERSGSGRSRRSGRSGSHRSRRSGDESSSSSSSRSRSERSERRARRERRERRRRRELERSRDYRRPRHFLFCFPWIESSRIRMQILRCFVSGMFVALTVSIYLSLALTQNINSTEFTILLIILVVFVTIFFCHSLIRLIMLVVKARKRAQARQRGQLRETAPAAASAYALPAEPIPVVLARDEEAAGVASEETKTGPPAYGVWRESVRADPNRLYWVRKEQPVVQDGPDIISSSGSVTNGTTTESTTDSTDDSLPRSTVPRPPSYSSDDGVSYVVDARPRSIAPRPTGPPGHPADAGMAGSWI